MALHKNDISNLEKILGHSFKKQKLLLKALTHTSTGNIENYERLEFLGDRVLGLVIAEMLFKKFPKEKEGDLAKRLAALVQGPFLAKVAIEINLGLYLTLSDGERQSGGTENHNILADVMESMIGALYLDGGLKPCENFIQKHWDAHLNTMQAPPQHPKTALQEWTQKRGLSLPIYKITDQSGPDHAPVFEITLNIEGFPPLKAKGKSRQIAEKKAAQNFIMTIVNTTSEDGNDNENK